MQHKEIRTLYKKVVAAMSLWRTKLFIDVRYGETRSLLNIPYGLR